MNEAIVRFLRGFRPAQPTSQPMGQTGRQTGTEHPFDLAKLRGDASNRVYYRLRLGDGPVKTLIVMQLPTEARASEEATSAATPAELPFTNIARYLSGAAIAVPAVYAHDEAAGLVFLEDLGDVLLEALVAEVNDATRAGYYRAAIDIVVEMQRYAESNPDARCVAFGRRFDEALLTWELEHFVEWGIEARTGKRLRARDGERIRAAFAVIVQALVKAPQTFVHRDFQSRNLLFQDGRLRVIDFQDALMGPIVYDLVALLRDSYVRLSRELVDQMIGYYCEKRGDFEKAAIVRLFHLQTVQRKLKDAGRFVFIDRVKKNPSFLPSIPASLGYVRDALVALPELRDLHDALIPYTPELTPQ